MLKEVIEIRNSKTLTFRKDNKAIPKTVGFKLKRGR